LRYNSSSVAIGFDQPLRGTHKRDGDKVAIESQRVPQLSADEMNWLLQTIDESGPVSFFDMVRSLSKKIGGRSAVGRNWAEQ